MGSPHDDYKSFILDLDTQREDEVAFPRALSIEIAAGTLEFPPVDNVLVANRLLVFTGTTIFNVKGHDGNLTRLVIRVRLHHAVPNATAKFVGSASVAALASIHGEDDEDSVFAVDGAETVPEPTAGGVLDSQGLPGDELYLLLDVAVLGDDALLSRIAYQANVLILDTAPDIARVLIREAGSSADFLQSADVTIGHKWEMKVTLTGPNPGPNPFPFTVSTSDPANVPIDGLDSIQQVPASAQSMAVGMRAPVGTLKGTTATITVHGRQAIKTATIRLVEIT